MFILSKILGLFRIERPDWKGVYANDAIVRYAGQICAGGQVMYPEDSSDFYIDCYYVILDYAKLINTQYVSYYEAEVHQIVDTPVPSERNIHRRSKEFRGERLPQ